MRLKQISVFLENTPGHLERVCKTIADAKININTITIAETRDYGIVRTIVDNPEKAETVLKENGFFAKIIDVLAVEVDDTPGALLAILTKTSIAGINIEYMYAMTRPMHDKPVMIMAFKDIDAAEAILSGNSNNTQIA